YILRNREIEVCQTRTAHDADAGIAKCLRGWTQRREGIRVEPTLDGSLRSRQLGIRDEVGSSDAIAAEIQNGVAADNRGQWQSALHDMNAGNLPIAEEQVHRLAP